MALGEYDYLSETDPILVEEGPIAVNIHPDALAKGVIRGNYGLHRVLSALVREGEVKRPNSTLVKGIRALLDQGHCH